jgi:sugar transferase EpsL
VSRVLKRLVDVAVSATMLTITAPVIAASAAAIRLSMGAPVLFRQKRPGIGGKPFYVFKFRTMSSARDASGSLLPDAARMTRVGQFLRTSSIDELPQLLNVLRGDMSLVGPRPLLMQYLSRYTPEQSRRHDVLPGITGWAQVHGRNAITWEEKFALDIWYVENASFMLDMKILVLTALKVVRRDGISGEGHATMPEFMGAPL